MHGMESRRMSVQEIALEEMSAEDLLIEMVRPETTELHRVRLRERLVEMHEWLAIEITRRYRYRGESMDDLKQAAYVGLMKAVNGFDALRFYGNQTQAEIAAEFGISQMHVSRILRNVLTGLRQALAD
jgi:DNA-directed RNA polymerase specialized sigma subunit